MGKRSVDGVLLRRSRNRCIGQDFVLLDARLALVLFVDILERGFSQQLPRQDHHPDESARTIGGRLRKHGIRAALVPGSAGTIGRRAASGVDANAALDQATNPGAPMPMQKGTAAGRKTYAVTAQEKLAVR